MNKQVWYVSLLAGHPARTPRYISALMVTFYAEFIKKASEECFAKVKPRKRRVSEESSHTTARGWKRGSQIMLTRSFLHCPAGGFLCPGLAIGVEAAMMECQSALV